MTDKRKKSSAAPEDEPFPCPWVDLSPEGANLDVLHFPTTLMSLVGAVLRRAITVPYLEAEGFTVPEWKILSVLQPGVVTSFAEIEILACTDKAIVSRTLRRLEERGLVMIKDRGNVGRKKLTSMITGAGAQAVERVLAEARRKQAELLQMLDESERQALYRALQVWHKAYAGKYTPRHGQESTP